MVLNAKHYTIKDISPMDGDMERVRSFMRTTGKTREHFMANGKLEKLFLKVRDVMGRDIGL
jgi:hypothetical protein